MNAPEGPIVLADIGDNPGGGAPADGTILLEALLRLGAKNAVVVPINDPESAEAAFNAGLGNRVSLELGAKVDHFHGEPLHVNGRVVLLSDGRFVHRGLMSTGVEMNMGPTAVVEIDGANGGSVKVVVTTHRYQPTDLEVLRSQDIEPTTMQIIAVKSSVHFRSAFMPIARQVIEVDTPGLTSPRLDRLEFHKIRRPIYPFDADMHWEP
jgi:microcystin degradation protein MlrC